MSRFENGFCWFFNGGQAVYFGKYTFPAQQSPTWSVWLVPGFED